MVETSEDSIQEYQTALQPLDIPTIEDIGKAALEMMDCRSDYVQLLAIGECSDEYFTSARKYREQRNNLVRLIKKHREHSSN